MTLTRKALFIRTVIKNAAVSWFGHGASSMGAATAFYGVLSLAPLVILLLSFAEWALGSSRPEEVTALLEGYVGRSSAETIRTVVESAEKSRASAVATVSGIVVSVLGASAVFGQIQASLNTIWEVTARPDEGWLPLVTRRLASFAMILAGGATLLILFIARALVSAFQDYLARRFPVVYALSGLIDYVVLAVPLAFLFTVTIKILPDARVEWRDAFRGGVFTALLFVTGNIFIAAYLGSQTSGSAYGAAGSVIVLLSWVYYSSQILFFGAEFTRSYQIEREKAASRAAR